VPRKNTAKSNHDDQRFQEVNVRGQTEKVGNLFLERIEIALRSN